MKKRIFVRLLCVALLVVMVINFSSCAIIVGEIVRNAGDGIGNMGDLIGNIGDLTGNMDDLLPDSVSWDFDEDTGTLTISGKGKMDDYLWGTDNPPWYEFSRDIKSVVIEEGITHIGKQAFAGCNSIEDVEIPNSIKSIGTLAFGIYLREFNFNELDGVCYLGNEENPYLVLATLHFDGYFSSLKTLDIPDSTKIILDSAFSLSSLESINIPANIIYIGTGAFTYCSELESITVDKDNAFYYSTNNCVIEKDTKTVIGMCKGSVLPDDGSIKHIEEGMFDSYSGTSVFIPDGVISIGASAFTSTEVTEISLPASLERLDDVAIYNYNLVIGKTKIIYRGTMAQWKKVKGTGRQSLNSYEVICSDGIVTVESELENPLAS